MLDKISKQLSAHAKLITWKCYFFSTHLYKSYYKITLLRLFLVFLCTQKTERIIVKRPSLVHKVAQFGTNRQGY